MTFTSTEVTSPTSEDQGSADHRRRRVLWGWVIGFLLLATLAPFSGPLIEQTQYRLSSAWDRCQSDLRTIETCLARYQHNNGKLPTEAEGLQALVAAPPSARSKSPILKSNSLVDAWGGIYQYRPFVNDPSGYDLFSLGADGIEGTRDDIHLDP